MLTTPYFGLDNVCDAYLIISDIYLAVLHAGPGEVRDRRVHPQSLADHRFDVTHAFDRLVVDLAVALLQDIDHLGIRPFLRFL